MAQLKQQFTSENISEIFDKTRDFAGKAGDKSRELYSRLEDNLSDEALTALKFASLGVAAGIVGFQLGKIRYRSPARERIRKNISKAESDLSNFDFSPVYKLVKLWMLYRIAI